MIDKCEGQRVGISMIICTRNRNSALQRCLETLKDLKDPAVIWELVLVDNGSTDATPQIVKEFIATSSINVRYIFEATPGLSNARNAGLAQSSGGIVAFTDDDCYPQPDFLVETLRAFENPKVGFVTGRIKLHDPDDYPATINESIKPLEFPPGSFLPTGSVRGANLSFRRETLTQKPPFDPLFGSGALFPAEDVDTSARVSRAGWVGLYVPEIVVSHHHGRKRHDIGQLKKSYDIGRGAYHAKLALYDRAFWQSAQGWLGLASRVLKRPASLWWEIKGGIGYWRAFQSSSRQA